MFTGLIQDTGVVKGIIYTHEGKELTIEVPSFCNKIGIGDSIAVNGVCLTATQAHQDCFVVQVVHITLKKTSIGMLQIGSLVNLELALKATDRLGGHFVQGHVNGLGRIESIISYGKNYNITLSLDHSLMQYIVAEGSITLDGISLTIADCVNNKIVVSIIPHTWQSTHLHKKTVGDVLNVEVDIIAKYIKHLMQNMTKKLLDQRVL